MFCLLAPLFRLANCQIKYTSLRGLLMAPEVILDLAPEKPRKETSKFLSYSSLPQQECPSPSGASFLIKRCTLKIWLKKIYMVSHFTKNVHQAPTLRYKDYLGHYVCGLGFILWP